MPLASHQLVLRVLRHLVRRGTALRRELSEDLLAEGVVASDDRVVAALRALREEGLAQQVGNGRTAAWRAARPEVAEQRGFVDHLALRFGQEHLSFAAGTGLVEPIARLLDERPVSANEARTFERRFHLIEEPARRYAHQADDVNRLVEALRTTRRVEFLWKGERLDVEPWCLVVYRRALYLVAVARPQDDPRSYAVDRLADVALREPFRYPPRARWNPEAHFGPWFGVYVGTRRERYVFRFDADKAELVRARTWHPRQRVVTLPDGRVELSFHSGGVELNRFAHEWGETVEVVEPAWFREQVRASLRAALERYRDGPD